MEDLQLLGCPLMETACTAAQNNKADQMSIIPVDE